ncbi:hypothetical protein [Natronococcus occultus]|uniref:Uncharacterized protein n=1 Tax=Natronococcus occultus SP4 TaxID=694430 RepID=L0K0D7_9EURY|nr:hypothetical protein [Natronococcus occultus]AGB37784.1 hypothetical protein Natoc_1997 [Natronococcus occultus SP4]
MDVPELTNNAYQFIDGLIEIYREVPNGKHGLVGELANLEGAKYGDAGIAEMPVSHPNYGELVTDTSEEYYLKVRSADSWPDITQKMPKGYKREEKHGCHYLNECFGEARVWLEAKERGREHMELFAPVVGYDGEDFLWTVMLKCQNMPSRRPGAPDPEETHDPKSLGWKPHDTESGLLDGRKVAYDYGMWRREHDEWIVAEEDVFKQNPVYRSGF